MILAAGMGTRLMPLTKDKPKALVEVAGCTLLERNIRKMISFGIKHIVINTYHFPEQIHEYIERRQYPADIYFSDEKEELLDTGGGFLNAERYFTKTQPILLHNVDIISDIDFKQVESRLQTEEALALLCVSERQTERHLLFDADNRLCGRDNLRSGETHLSGNGEPKYSYAFSGIHFLQPEIFNLFTLKGRFSILEQYLLLADRYPIRPFLHSAENWYDVGKIDSLEAIEKALEKHRKCRKSEKKFCPVNDK